MIKNKAQGALEYLLLIGGAVLIAAIVLVLVTTIGQQGGAAAGTRASNATCAVFDIVSCEASIADSDGDGASDCEWDPQISRCVANPLAGLACNELSDVECARLSKCAVDAVTGTGCIEKSHCLDIDDAAACNAEAECFFDTVNTRCQNLEGIGKVAFCELQREGVCAVDNAHTDYDKDGTGDCTFYDLAARCIPSNAPPATLLISAEASVNGPPINAIILSWFMPDLELGGIGNENSDQFLIDGLFLVGDGVLNFTLQAEGYEDYQAQIPLDVGHNNYEAEMVPLAGAGDPDAEEDPGAEADAAPAEGQCLQIDDNLGERCQEYISLQPIYAYYKDYATNEDTLEVTAVCYVTGCEKLLTTITVDLIEQLPLIVNDTHTTIVLEDEGEYEFNFRALNDADEILDANQFGHSIYVDRTQPTATLQSSNRQDTLTPLIVFELKDTLSGFKLTAGDGSSLVDQHLQLTVNGAIVPAADLESAVIREESQYTFSYQVQEDLPAGRVTVSLDYADLAGNDAQKEWTFIISCTDIVDEDICREISVQEGLCTWVEETSQCIPVDL